MDVGIWIVVIKRIKINVDSCHVDPPFLGVDPPRLWGNICKSYMMVKNTTGY